ncbi:pro-resilin-like [Copidosoma floridanum]|uniref:pro-resilin-like n=1 Tax=Copidosoma floridanum TaxID=29053 RepID=UPI0006C96B21|nr:pro-resilin-like [Copidosoma floridanum]
MTRQFFRWMCMTLIYHCKLSLLWLSAVALTVGLADLPPGIRLRANANTYLPPDTTKGYDYNKPPGPGFPSPGTTPGRPPVGPPARPPTGPPARPPSTPGGYPSPGGPGDHGGDHVHEPGMPFDFNYAVKEDAYGNDYSHNAISDGDVTRGEYRVQLPDGRTQIVRYTADWKNGFMAQVSYEGTPSFGPGVGTGPQGPGGGNGVGGGGGGPFQGY